MVVQSAGLNEVRQRETFRGVKMMKNKKKSMCRRSFGPFFIIRFLTSLLQSNNQLIIRKRSDEELSPFFWAG